MGFFLTNPSASFVNLKQTSLIAGTWLRQEKRNRCKLFTFASVSWFDDRTITVRDVVISL